MATCDSKSGYHKYMCFEEIGPCVQNMITIVVSTTRIVQGELHDHLMTTIVFTLAFIWALQNYEESDYNLNLDLLTILY